MQSSTTVRLAGATLLATFGFALPASAQNMNYPLLGSAHGGHVWDSFCDGKSDDTLLPPDPRSLVQPGTNAGKAVFYNEVYHDCHIGADTANAPPTTCGERRARVAKGLALIGGNGAVGAGALAGGNSPQAGMGYIFNAATYNNLWRSWGMLTRPANFDQWVAERYGWPLSAAPNPYPLPGEDPNQTNGGSGQLPTAFTQLRNTDGSWTGRMALTCNACHSGKVGDASEGAGLGQVYGTNSLSDFSLIFRDLGASLVGTPGALLPFALNKTRGTGNITNYQLLEMLYTVGDLPATAHYNQSLIFANASGSEDAPAWWNIGHRVLKFYDGSRSVDSTRIMLSAMDPLLVVGELPGPLNQANIETWVEAHDQDAAAWLSSLKSPVYPGTINTALAEQGAVLFHEKNLWDPALNNPVPKPAGGNGSCASCHGAYSPRYVNDPNFIDRPELEGLAAYRVPISTINTDPGRMLANDVNVANYDQYNWFSYPAYPGGTSTCEPSIPSYTDSDKRGYVPPPLYGVWASAPYFHNGSVPTLWDLLKPSDRPAIWRRVSAPRPTNLSLWDQVNTANATMGFDTNFARAYDQVKAGWKYDILACDPSGLNPALTCGANGGGTDALFQQLLNQFFSSVAALWNVFVIPPVSQQDIENRKIYNTSLYSQGNGGHKAAAVLTDDERLAIIEYLKTL